MRLAWLRSVGFFGPLHARNAAGWRVRQAVMADCGDPKHPLRQKRRGVCWATTPRNVSVSPRIGDVSQDCDRWRRIVQSDTLAMATRTDATQAQCHAQASRSTNGLSLFELERQTYTHAYVAKAHAPDRAHTVGLALAARQHQSMLHMISAPSRAQQRRTRRDDAAACRWRTDHVSDGAFR